MVTTKFKVGDVVYLVKNSSFYQTPMIGAGSVVSVLLNNTGVSTQILYEVKDYMLNKTYVIHEPDLELVNQHASGMIEPINGSVVVDTTVKQEGIKHDQQKPDLTDIPMDAMFEMGKAFTYGQKKYGKNNYRNGMEASRQLAAAIRHIYQHLDGETFDKESGAMHLGHALASIAMAVYTIKNLPHLDNRHGPDLERYKNDIKK